MTDEMRQAGASTSYVTKHAINEPKDFDVVGCIFSHIKIIPKFIVEEGRPAGSYNKKKASPVVALYNQKNTINFIEDNLKISRSTIYQYLRKEGVKVNGFTKSKIY
jgi:hypothetical protein